MTAAFPVSMSEPVVAPVPKARTEVLPDAMPEPSALRTTLAPTARWPSSRIAAVEALWGSGFTMPGGGPETLRLAKPLGLSSSVTLLLVGDGLGGPAAAISTGFGAWVSSFEADPHLMAVAIARRPILDPKGRITVQGWDRSAPQFRPRSANSAMSLEALRGSKPWPLLESIAGALRPQGQIVLTELVSDESPNEKDREFAAWCRLEGRLPELPRSDEVTKALQKLHFDVRVMEDMSDRHITQTLGGWREAVKAMAAGPKPTMHTAAAFVTEAELWLLRISLMRRLGVRLMRWHAIGTS
jgi:cyclopropane fatty-acyl-phospholipid synthase-like methyltransferase